MFWSVYYAIWHPIQAKDDYNFTSCQNNILNYLDTALLLTPSESLEDMAEPIRILSDQNSKADATTERKNDVKIKIMTWWRQPNLNVD